MGRLEEFNDDSYDFLIRDFTKEVIVSRYDWLYDMLQDYISMRGLCEEVCVSEDILNHVLIDFFVDIHRVKEFSNIEQEHDSKIYAYLAYWLLRHKPIQIPPENAGELAFINEEFVREFLSEYLFCNPTDVPISSLKEEDIDNFLETMLYYFKYRHYDAQSIEIMILAFVAGRGYQYSADYRK